jgi:hypothetical protein
LIRRKRRAASRERVSLRLLDCGRRTTAKHLILTIARVVVGAGAHAQQPAPAKPGDNAAARREARAAFLKKCFRNRTRESCEAPPAARANS